MLAQASQTVFGQPLAPWQGEIAPLAEERFGWTSLIRQGQRPLGFMGRVLFDISVNDPSLPVWSDVSVHEVEGQFMVAAIRHQLRGTDGLSRHYAQECDDTESLLDFLHAHDPLSDLPAEALYAAAEGLNEPERQFAATACARRLRLTWRQILQTCFSTPPNPGIIA